MKVSVHWRLLLITVLAGLVLAAGCGGPKAEEVFAIYLLEENPPAASPGQPLGSLDELTLQAEPLLTIADLDFYDYATHCIYLNDQAVPFAARFPSANVSSFVLVAGGERCYLGYFISPVSSYLPMTPFIMMDANFSFYPEDILAIYYPQVLDISEDVRRDGRIRDSLLAAGKLREGLSVALSDVAVADRRAGATTLSYTITITNNDDGAVYVPDPDKMGSGIFHYYTNGVVITGKDPFSHSMTASPPRDISPPAPDEWELAWFTRLGGGETITRTVRLGGYPDIPPGTYNCHFTYSGPSHIGKSERSLPDGRLWLGEIQVAEYEFVVSD